MNRSIKINPALTKATQHWKYVAPLLSYTKNKTEYNLLVQSLDIIGTLKFELR